MMLITPHIYRSSDSIGAVAVAVAVAVGGVKEGRKGDWAIFSHLVKYLGGTSVECSSSAAAAASIWVVWMGRVRAGRVRSIVLYSYHNTVLSLSVSLSPSARML